MTPLRLVGHPNHACEFDRKAFDRLAEARGTVAVAELVLVWLEENIESAWCLRRVRSQRAHALLLLRGYIACARSVVLLARRPLRLPVTSWRNGRIRPEAA